MVVQCDLSSLGSIRAFAAQLLQQEQNIDIVVLNAAIRGCPMVRMLGFTSVCSVKDHMRNGSDYLLPAAAVVLTGGV